MKIFLETNDMDEIRGLNKAGVLDGVVWTGTSDAAQVRAACEATPGPVFVRVSEKDAARVAEMAHNAVASMLCSMEALTTARLLSSAEKRVCLICRTATQALLSGNAGVSFVLLTVGALEAGGHNGVELVEDTRPIFDNYGFETQICAGGLERPSQVRDAARIGADACTVSAATLKMLA